jgi:hypothetical protein
MRDGNRTRDKMRMKRVRWRRRDANRKRGKMRMKRLRRRRRDGNRKRGQEEDEKEDSEKKWEYIEM